MCLSWLGVGLGIAACLGGAILFMVVAGLAERALDGGGRLPRPAHALFAALFLSAAGVVSLLDVLRHAASGRGRRRRRRVPLVVPVRRVARSGVHRG